jgi:hypothetical protein
VFRLATLGVSFSMSSWVRASYQQRRDGNPPALVDHADVVDQVVLVLVLVDQVRDFRGLGLGLH